MTEIKIMADEELMAGLSRLREIHSHSMPGATFAELIKRAVKTELVKSDPAKKAERATSRASKKQKIALGNNLAVPINAIKSSKTVEAAGIPTPAELTRSRYIPATVRHAVWMRDKGRCTFVDEQTGECCGSRSFVQCDHIIAFANGGENTVENLRLRCQAHNHRHSIKTYGAITATAWRERSQSRIECVRLAYG